MSEFSDALLKLVHERIETGEWTVIAIAGSVAVPDEIRRWCAEQFHASDPILLVLEKVIQPAVRT